MKLYTIYDNKTDLPVIVDGTARKAAAALGQTLSNFRSTVSKARSGKIKRWTVEVRDRRKVALNSNVKQLIKQHGYTQKQLAIRCRCNETYISMCIKNKRYPSVKMLKKIAAALEVSVREVIKNV